MKVLAICYLTVCFFVVFTHARGNVKQPQRSCPGCLNELQPTHPDIQKYANYAVTKYKQSREIPQDARLVRIFDAKSQVVAGIRYEFMMEFAYNLPRNAGQYSALCKVEVIKKAGTQQEEITTHPCKKPRLPAPVPGVKTF